MKFEIPMRPWSKERPRFTKTKTGKAITYMSLKYRLKQWKCIQLISPALSNIEGIDVPETYADFRRSPKQWFEGISALFGPNKALKLEVEFNFNKSNRCDSDNLIGAIMDAFNGVIWTDDIMIKELGVMVNEHMGYNLIRLNVREIESEMIQAVNCKPAYVRKRRSPKPKRSILEKT